MYLNSNPLPNLKDSPKILAQLLALLILFQHKIQTSKQQLAGHDQFDSRVAFLSMDKQRKGFINAQDLINLLQRNGKYDGLLSHSIQQINQFFKKYGNGQRMSYWEFVKQIKPKMNDQLAQTLLIRNIVKKQLPPHLEQKFQTLIALYLIMTIEAQNLRKTLQTNYGLNFSDIVKVIRGIMISQQKIYKFVKDNNIEVELNKIIYLKNHTKNNTDFKDFSDQDIREIFLPVTSLRKFQDLPIQKSKQNMNTIYSVQYSAKKDNYLGYTHSKKMSYNNQTLNQNFTTISRKDQGDDTQPKLPQFNESFDLPNIQNFVKGKKNVIRETPRDLLQNNKYKTSGYDTFEIDKFLLQKNKKNIEKFQDDLEGLNDSSQPNAFEYN